MRQTGKRDRHGEIVEQRARKRADHNGSTFDSFLEQEGIREEVEAVATKRVYPHLSHTHFEQDHPGKNASRRGEGEHRAAAGQTGGCLSR